MSSSSSESDEEEQVVDTKAQKRSKSHDGSATKKKKLKASLPAPAPLQVVDSSSSTQPVATTFGSKNATTCPVIVILDQATLETVKNRRGVFELLNCDDHRDLCRKKLKKDPNDFRPDILHQEMLSLLDSPLNKAGMLKVYVQTKKRVLIDVHPSIRLPRTYKRFAGLMVQLLHKMKIKAGSESTTLLKVIKNPVSQYLPAGTRCFGMSCQGTLYRPMALAKALLPESADDAGSPPTCFVVGAMSTGHVTIDDHPYIEKMLSVSDYPLSGAGALSRLMAGIEEHWGII